MNSFSSCHPACCLSVLFSAIIITMFSLNPAVNVVSVICAASFYILSSPKDFKFKSVLPFVLFFVMVTAANPIFSANGETVIVFINSRPITLESLLYGADAALVMISVLIWFLSLSRHIDEGKVLYLTGSFFPKTSQVISSAIRFIPLLKNRYEMIKSAQTVSGLYISDSWTVKIKNVLRVYSSLITWSLEGAVETGSSMKARGYGLKPRRSYHSFKFSFRDGFLVSVCVLCDVLIIVSSLCGENEFLFYPTISFKKGILSLASSFACAIVMLLPVITEITERLKWKYYVSKI